MNQWGIKNYQPNWTDSSQELVGFLLQASLKSQTIKSIWMLWDEEDREWFEDAPVIICMATEQLEFCANKLEYFSVSFNSIDLTAPVYWCLKEDEIDDTEQPMYWMEVKDSPDINSLLGKKITEVFAIEYQTDRNLQEWLDKDEWLLNGVGFCIEDRCLQILNGLDCNRLDFKLELDSDLRKISLD